MVLLGRFACILGLETTLLVLPRLLCYSFIMEVGVLALTLLRAFQRALDCENQAK